MAIQAIRGTKDILPKEAALWQDVEEKARRLFAFYGYREIRTPILEEVSLFKRSVGEATDIVEKQMFTFEDRGERVISLRPEETASCVRAYLEHGLHKEVGFSKFYYIGPMFRSERPQAGRMRQFHQIGIEAIGSLSPYLDAEVISLLMKLLEAIGIDGSKLKINSIGCKADREKYSQVLRDSLKGSLGELCDDCKARYEKNVMRILDCKNETCRRVAARLPKATDNLCDECSGHFKGTLSALDGLNIKYEIDPHLVRGLDYYTRTTFEVSHPKLGSQDAVAAGGRYDYLVEQLGGPSMGAIGFAVGIERAMAILAKAMGEKKDDSGKGAIDLYLVTLGEAAYKKAFSLLDEARRAGVSCDMDYEGRSLKGQMRRANDLGAKYVAVIGDDELAKGAVKLKRMADGVESEVKFDELVMSLRG